MKAIGYHQPGSIDRDDALLDLDIPAPTPGPQDLLVRVKAVSVNPVDVKIRAGSPAPEGGPKILGWDAAGIVEAVGDAVTLFRRGDAVFYAGDITRPGANAELHTVDARIVGHKPTSLDWAEAAALPLTAITAWELLFERLNVPHGRKQAQGSLLVINGAGGVGSILIQMARRLTGLTVIATASRPETIAWAEQMGAHHVIDHHKPLDEELVRIGHPEVHYVAGLTASDRYLPLFPKIVAAQGHIALIDDPAHLDIVPLKRKSITVAWELMFTRAMFHTPDMIEQHRLLEEVAQLVDAGVLRTTLRERIAGIHAANLKQVHALLESGRAIGKTVLEAL
ncbi:zinc-binding alcohol dehydrogenase family protein [Sphingomonas sp. ABOLD]|uniref:Zinc-type alcohol dehydrogenase-like protein n=1 Tax=Sphingomonas trueperi TaxID=53317 RepID=A0A7X6BC73_9SPHN|nr:MULTISPECIES: zinc-binding alcohol dehydrogenase family protein [Sphingomonas]NJB97248.1 zinc-binding alcohol dehydrogenase family protein [Sphingomonas trueperi]RSV40429.1 zinc-binding alcohol dehydrogenase family protein [Sphingomonas sp. ABOLE]RSV49311.1 zinc-binding alcohol dehydrogenase family protein [Sphingomonas sp. ABOLD]